MRKEYNIYVGCEMKTLSSGNFITFNSWFDNVIDENVVLCYTSALEALGMFNGSIDETEIDVYALETGKYDNIHYHIIPDFSAVRFQSVGKVRCTTFDQTINDMLKDVYIDRTALTEAIANYYHSHGDSFEGLIIDSENKTAFEEIKEDAINYYNEY